MAENVAAYKIKPLEFQFTHVVHDTEVNVVANLAPCNLFEKD